MKILSAVLFFALAGATAYSEEKAKIFSEEKAGTAGKSVVLGNSCFTMEILPETGGGCGRITVDGQDFFTPDPKTNCFLRDVFNTEAMEKQAISESKPYRYAVSKNEGGDIATLKMSRNVGKDKWEQDFAGAGVEKTISVRQDKPYFTMASAVDNKSGKAVYINFGFRNYLRMNKMGKDRYFLPTTQNILRVDRMINGFYAKSSSWEYEPVEGWMAVLDPDTKNGLVFIMGNKYLEAFYTSPNCDSCGWFLNGDELAPQKQFKTECIVAPVSGFDGFVHASPRIIADIQVREDKDDLAVKHTIFGLEKFSSVTLKTEVYGIRSKKTQPLPEVKFENVGGKISTQTLPLPGKQTEPLVIRVTASLDGTTEQYETYYEGKFPSNPCPGYPFKSEYKRQKAGN